MKYTDNQLKQALAKMLPEEVYIQGDYLLWNTIKGITTIRQVLDTEMLYLCQLVENTLDTEHAGMYLHHVTGSDSFPCFIRYPWQNRVAALCKVKGIKI